MSAGLSLIQEHSKECSKCRLPKPVGEFSPHKRSVDGLASSCLSCHRAQVNRYNQSDAGHAASRTPRRIFGRYVQHAKLRGIVFALSFSEFMKLWQVPCSYCKSSISTVGVDRVDNNSGYIMGNVVPCCTICNRMKLTSSKDDFIEQCRRVVMVVDSTIMKDR
jgi:hypothetical protein